MSGLQEAKRRYEKWWVGKHCKPNSHMEGGKVIEVKTYGPKSFVYGGASLIYECGTEVPIPTYAYKPRKCDVTIIDKS